MDRAVATSLFGIPKMKTLLCKTRRATSAAIVAIFLAVLAANSIARGQITYLKSYGISGPEFVAVGADGPSLC